MPGRSVWPHGLLGPPIELTPVQLAHLGGHLETAALLRNPPRSKRHASKTPSRRRRRRKSKSRRAKRGSDGATMAALGCGAATVLALLGGALYARRTF